MTTNTMQHCAHISARGALTENTVWSLDLGDGGSAGGSELPGGEQPWWMPTAGGEEDDCPEPRESGDMMLAMV